MIPLSTENWSVGRPAIFHARILTGSPRVAIREKSSEHGIPLSLTDLIHASIWSWNIYNINDNLSEPLLKP
jgi:hypothetical protein